MPGRTHYDTLGLEPTASPDEIRRAWKTLIQVWHPDRFSGRLRVEAEEMTKAINDAYDVLRDQARRHEYDTRFGHGKAAPTHPPKPEGRGSEQSRRTDGEAGASGRHPGYDRRAPRQARGAVAFLTCVLVFLASLGLAVVVEDAIGMSVEELGGYVAVGVAMLAMWLTYLLFAAGERPD